MIKELIERAKLEINKEKQEQSVEAIKILLKEINLASKTLDLLKNKLGLLEVGSLSVEELTEELSDEYLL